MKAFRGFSPHRTIAGYNCNFFVIFTIFRNCKFRQINGRQQNVFVHLLFPSSSAILKKIRLKIMHNLTNRSNLTTWFAERCVESWLLPCSLCSHRTANPTPQNGLRHFSALPARHSYGWRKAENIYNFVQ